VAGPPDLFDQCGSLSGEDLNYKTGMKNIRHSTSKIEHPVGAALAIHGMLGVRCWMFGVFRFLGKARGGVVSCCGHRQLWLRRFAWIGLLLFAVIPASALNVQQVRWGFDGQVVPGRFNLLSVLVANPAARPFDGAVNFYKTHGLAERVGAIFTTPCYLAPFTERWLQFYVYIDNPYDQWRLTWGRGPNDHDDLRAPQWGPPAQVFLSDAETPLSEVTAFKQFPEELFPTTVAATSGLDSVLLDHAPHWEPAKRQAFLDWLQGGGKVYLLTGADGRYPVFSDELSVLNSSQKRLRIGAGLVVRHAVTAGEIRPQDVPQDDPPFRAFKPGTPAMPDQTASSFLGALGRLSQRRYSWSLIYLLAIAYVALVGPVNLRVGRKLADYRLRIALLLATVAGFAFLFNLVGRRGQGEASVVDSLSYARAIGGDRYDVMQWVNVFATHGAHYTITHDAPHNLYATSPDYEPVNGVIENGKDGRFVVDIPMFSRRAFLHEAEMKGPGLPVKIVSWDGNGRLKRLVVTVGPEFTKQVLEGWVVQGNQIYGMQSVKDGLEFGDSNRQSLKEFVSASTPQPFEVAYGQPQGNQVAAVEGQFRKLAKPVIAWSLNPEDLTRLGALSPAASERAQLFLFARSPAGFSITGSALGHETGYVLYRFDLFKPGTPE
jgi:hypothetical protein